MKNLKSIDTRSSKVFMNIVGSFFIKGWAGLVQLLLVPITFACLGEYEYGVWMTLSSVLLWVDSFDLGLGNGLRNRLASYIALDDWEKARQAVSTTCIMLLALLVPIVLCVSWLLESLDIYNILDLKHDSLDDLTRTIQMALAFVGGTFVLKVLGNIYLALQLPAINNLLVVLGQTLALLAIYVGDTLLQDVSLMYVVGVSTAAPLLVYIAAWPITLSRYPRLRPRFSCFQVGMVRDLLGMGLGFFVLQIAGLVLFLSSNLLITKLLGAEQVTPYQISYRYFSFVSMLFGIVVAPLWSATTDAYVKRDLDWIKACTAKMRRLLLLFFCIIGVMIVVAHWVYPLWVGADVGISSRLTFLMGVYTALLLYSLYYAHILFGIGFIRLQMYVTLMEAVVFIPLAIWLSEVMRLEGVVLALIIVNSVCAVTNRWQYAKIISGRATGIWVK